MSSCVVLQAIITIIYLQYPLYIRGATMYTTIWFDAMESQNDWIISEFASVQFGVESDMCHTGKCVEIIAPSSAYADTGFIYKNTDVSLYDELQIQVDISTSEISEGDSCDVYYSDGNKINLQQRTRKIKIAPPPITGLYPNQTFTIDSSNMDTIWIYLDNEGGIDDFCYFDNVYLKANALPAISNPTLHSTSDPSNAPIFIATEYATFDPTLSPSSNPTSSPIPNVLFPPTSAPLTTLHPITRTTLDPTQGPTSSPTKTRTPTYDPISTHYLTTHTASQQTTGFTKTSVYYYDDDDSMSKTTKSILDYQLVMVILIGAAIGVCAFAVYFWKKQKMESQKNSARIREEIRNVDIEPGSVPQITDNTQNAENDAQKETEGKNTSYNIEDDEFEIIGYDETAR